MVILASLLELGQRAILVENSTIVFEWLVLLEGSEFPGVDLDIRPHRRQVAVLRSLELAVCL